MAKQSLLFTALPNGYSGDGKSLRLSVLVSPRLDAEAGPQQLASFPDFVDWPKTLAASKFTIHYGASWVTVAGTPTAGKNRVDTTIGKPDSTLWSALFPKTTFVRGFAFRDLSGNSVLSYSTTDAASIVKGLYTDLARRADQGMPLIADLTTKGPWKGLVSAVQNLDRAFWKEGTAHRDTARQFQEYRRDRLVGATKQAGGSPVALTLARLELFHTPPARPRLQQNVPKHDPRTPAEWRTHERATLPGKADFAKEIDFHEIVAALNQYPTLLRRTGLVVDFLVDAQSFSLALDEILWVSVDLPQGAPGVTPTPDASPRTRARLSQTQFQAVARPAAIQPPSAARITDGLLDLDPARFDLLQADVDGAGLKLMNFARSLGRAAAAGTVDSTTRLERSTGAPALRNAGLMLVHRDRGDMLQAAFDRQKALDTAAEAVQGGAPSSPPDLFAEDLVRGFRIDVWDGRTKVWRSLCRREAVYDVAGGAVTVKVPDEEGTVRLAATKSPDPSYNDDLVWLHEALVSWTGWSLCAPPPGKTIGADDKVHTGEAELPPGMRLSTRFVAVGKSLPRLRYGRKYWIRARVVDLAGNSLAPTEKDLGPENPTKNAQAYLRFEPIASPAIALVKPSGGDPATPAGGESMERVAIRTFNAVHDDPTLSKQTAERFAVPARTTAKEAELHGAIDSGGTVDATTFALLAGKDEALEEVKLKTSGPLATTGVETTYAVLEEGKALPYLPDPLALEVAARIFDHPTFSETEVIRIPLYASGGKWPDALPFKIQVFEDPTRQPEFVAAKRTLFVPLPKAVRATLRLSTAPSKDALALMGVWGWLTPAERQKLESVALDGQHWMLTPWRPVELVHAVQKPLLAPAMTLDVVRSMGATDAHPRFRAHVSIASTARLDLQARWNEPRDLASVAKGENRARDDHAFSVKIVDPQSYRMEKAGAALVGPDHAILKKDLIQVGGGFHDRLLDKVHEFGDTRYRRIEYWLEATTRFREYMPSSVLTKVVGGQSEPTDENIKVEGPKVVTWIPSSAPPPAPSVLYVVPTFGWVRTDTGTSKSRWRRGGGLRVYLDRPWLASGYGEMLAVVLPPAGFGGDPMKDPSAQPLKNFVTQWGNDPIWRSSFVTGVAPTRANFPLARTQRDTVKPWLPSFAPAGEADQPPGPFKVTGLQPPGLSSSVVELAPHDVFYDEERRLWYCDIEVSFGRSYCPFIRLALARYQPVSVPGAHLSNVVLADFMPLLPDRWLNVTRTNNPRVRGVAVFGFTYSDSSGNTEAKSAPSMSLKLPTGGFETLTPAAVSATSVVEIWVERLDPSLGEDFGWERDESAVVQPASARKPGPRVVDPVKLARDRTRAKALVRARDFATLARERLIGAIFVTPTLWAGTVTLPANAPAGARYRLVIAEYEEYLVDDSRPYDPVPTRKDRRLVFVEHVELE